MDENGNAEVGECVQIYKNGSRWNGLVGRVRYIYEERNPKLADVELDDGVKVRVALKNLIPRHTMACEEL